MAGANPRTSRAFDKRVYELAAIRDALEAYEPFATLELERSQDVWTVHFADVDEEVEPEMLASEFSNYVLVGTIERAR